MLLYLHPEQAGDKTGLLIFFTLFILVIPILLFLIFLKLKVVSDADATDRNERHYPYIAAVIMLLAGMIWLNQLTGLSLVKILYFSTLINLILLYFVNLFWKMSAHAMGVSGIAAAAYMISPYLFLVSLAISGAVGWSRVYLGKHTLLQVCTGGIIGFMTAIILFKTAGF